MSLIDINKYLINPLLKPGNCNLDFDCRATPVFQTKMSTLYPFHFQQRYCRYGVL